MSNLSTYHIPHDSISRLQLDNCACPLVTQTAFVYLLMLSETYDFILALYKDANVMNTLHKRSQGIRKIILCKFIPKN